MTLPLQYAWLSREPGPKVILEALKLYGTHEAPGETDNSVVLSWAKELQISWYVHDATPWCGLLVGIAVLRAGYPFDRNQLLAALDWVNFGIEIPLDGAQLGDILIFKRTGGGHVTFYVGEDSEAFHGLGGNQADQVDIARIPKSRLYAVRRPRYAEPPTNIRKIVLASSGQLSLNEA